MTSTDAEKQAAYTLLEPPGAAAADGGPGPERHAPARARIVLTGGWQSRAPTRTSGSSPRAVPRGPRQRDGGLRPLAPAGVRGACDRAARPLRPGGRGGPRAHPRGHLAPRGGHPRRRRARELLDRRHDARLGLPVLERPGARGAGRQAERRRQGGAARDRQQDADVHGALHGGLAAAEQPRAHVAGHVPEARLDAGGRGRRHARHALESAARPGVRSASSGPSSAGWSSPR
jgi:hypothetical protein